MKVGIQFCSFTVPGGTSEIAPVMERAFRAADDAGFDSIWLMDHLFQIRSVGPLEWPMLEGWTALGWMAALTKRARIGLLVGAAPYRLPAIWIKAATTLDVLSGGRAWLGLGAGWNWQEANGLGIPWPERRDRFAMLEDTLRMAHEMFAGERGSEAAFEGRVYQARRLLNSPQSISRPRVPIMIGGGGEQRTLKLVAQYADASNVFGGPEAIHHKWEVLRAHCEAVGRPFEDIERSTLQDIDFARGRQSAGQIVDSFGELADVGVQHVILSDNDLFEPDQIERLATGIIPQLREL
jgi:F420-dependent oxidoreductase-like protein